MAKAGLHDSKTLGRSRLANRCHVAGSSSQASYVGLLLLLSRTRFTSVGDELIYLGV